MATSNRSRNQNDKEAVSSLGKRIKDMLSRKAIKKEQKANEIRKVKKQV